jgi:CheY-like chemotaxis protein
VSSLPDALSGTPRLAFVMGSSLKSLQMGRPQSEGMRIGLSVSPSIVAQHHLRLWPEPDRAPAAIASFWVPSDPGEGERAGERTEDLLMDKRLLVSVVDDSDSVRESLPDLLQEFGFAAQAFASAEAFLASDAANHTSCLILDVGLPGMSGPDLQQELIRRGNEVPIVFITAQGDTSLRPRLLARGAAAFLLKPFSDDALLDAVTTALAKR